MRKDKEDIMDLKNSITIKSNKIVEQKDQLRVLKQDRKKFDLLHERNRQQTIALDRDTAKIRAAEITLNKN